MTEPTWSKSRRCDTSACVEVAELNEDTIGVRDSTLPDGTVLTFSKAMWLDFLRGARAGDFAELVPEA